MAVFISYSRRNTDSVRRLYAALVERGREAWVDWEGIPPSADWLREIEAAIDSAEAFVFVLSPDSLQSKVCGQELAHAVAQHKRLLPVVVADVAGCAIPAELARLNWVFLRDADGFDAGVDLLLQGVDTDLGWVQAHTRLLVRSREWEDGASNTSMLLTGTELKAAERWLAQGPDKQPRPTAGQTRYIIESRRQATKRRFQLLGGIAVAVVAVAVLGTLTVMEGRQAARQETLAQARRLAAAAERTRQLPPPAHALTPPQERSLQMAAEAVRRLAAIGEHSLDADLALRRALAVSAVPLLRLESAREFFDQDLLQFSDDGKLLAIGRDGVQSLRWDLPNAERVVATEIRHEQGWGSIHLDAASQWVAFSTGTLAAAGEGVVEMRHARNLEAVARWSGLPKIGDVAVGPRGLLAMAVITGEKGGRTLGETRLHDALQARPTATLPYLRYPTFSRDGRWFAATTADGHAVWAVDALLAGRSEPASRFEVADAWKIEFVDADRRLVTWRTDPERMALRGLDGRIEREWASDGARSVSPDGRWRLERENGYALNRIVDNLTGRELARLHSKTPDAPFAWSRDSTQIALSDGKAIAVWQLAEDGSAADSMDVGADALAFALGADDAGVTTLHRRGDGAAGRWSAARRPWGATQPSAVADLGPLTMAYAFSLDGRRLALGAPAPLRVLDLGSTRELHAAAPASAPTAAVALSGNGRHAAALDTDGRLTAWEVDAGRVLAQSARAASAVGNLLAIDDRGQTVAAVNLDGTTRTGANLSVRRWNVASMDPPASQPLGRKTSGLSASVCALAANADRVAVNTSGSALRVRDTRSGQDIATVDEAGPDPVCAFSADGRLLATSGVDDTLRIWDLRAQEEVARLALHARPRALAFSPSGGHVAALDERGVLRRWPLRASDLVAQACRRLRSNMSAADWSRFMPTTPYQPTCSKLPMAAEERQ